MNQIVLKGPARWGTTNAMGYGLSLQPIELPAAQLTVAQPSVAPEANRSETAPLEITYQEEMGVYPVPGLKHPLKRSLPDWCAVIVLMPIFGALAAGGLLARLLLTLWMSNEAPRVPFQWTVLTGCTAGMVAWVCHPFYVLINDRIVRAPTILEATLPLGHVSYFAGRVKIECYARCASPPDAQSATKKSRSRRGDANVAVGSLANAVVIRSNTHTRSTSSPARDGSCEWSAQLKVSNTSPHSSATHRVRAPHPRPTASCQAG